MTHLRSQVRPICTPDLLQSSLFFFLSLSQICFKTVLQLDFTSMVNADYLNVDGSHGCDVTMRRIGIRNTNRRPVIFIFIVFKYHKSFIYKCDYISFYLNVFI